MARWSAVAFASAAIGLVGACAQQGSPPGGPEDRRPPVVIATEPDTFATVEDFRGPIKFIFDERISERVDGGSLDDAVLLSPRTGALRIKHDRRSLVIEVDGGFQPGLVYRVTLLPVVRDLFSNQMKDPFELVFSTGGEMVPTTVAGLVWDRITGEGVDGIQVWAVPTEGDGPVHIARTDTAGIYAFRFLPAARFELEAFQDRNRNDSIDATELQGRRRFLIGDGDTLYLNLSVLQPDTSAARITKATALDSVTVLVEVDDFLDPTIPLAGVGVTLSREEGDAPAVRSILHEHEYQAYVDEVADSFARLDSLEAIAAKATADSLAAVADSQAAAADSVSAADTLTAADSLAVVAADSLAPADTALIELPVRAPAPRRRLPVGLEVREGRPARPATASGDRPGPRDPSGNPLPSRRLVILLDQPLEPNVAYQMKMTGVRNLSAVPLGGGESAVVLTPPPDSTAVDSAAADSTALIPPDTAAPLDTAATTPRR
jgi:regulator of extracellular matrix RemA (YlzA/DUF370 family)